MRRPRHRLRITRLHGLFQLREVSRQIPAENLHQLSQQLDRSPPAPASPKHPVAPRAPPYLLLFVSAFRLAPAVVASPSVFPGKAVLSESASIHIRPSLRQDTFPCLP